MVAPSPRPEEQPEALVAAREMALGDLALEVAAVVRVALSFCMSRTMIMRRMGVWMRCRTLCVSTSPRALRQGR